MTDPRTTVVVTTRNRREEVLRTLGTLAALPQRLPVIVTDNGSTDGTPEVVARHHPEVTLLTPGRNLGAAYRDLAVRRRAHGLRNTLWLCWLRRPALSASRRTPDLARTVHRDQASLRASGPAAAGPPWVLRQRRAVPPAVKARPGASAEAQRTSTARRHVG